MSSTKKKQSSLHQWIKPVPASSSTSTPIKPIHENNDEFDKENVLTSPSKNETNAINHKKKRSLTEISSAVPSSPNSTSSLKTKKSLSSSSISYAVEASKAKKLAPKEKKRKSFGKIPIKMKPLPEFTMIPSNRVELMMDLTWIHQFFLTFQGCFEDLIVPASLKKFTEWFTKPQENFKNLMKIYYELITSSSLGSIVPNKSETDISSNTLTTMTQADENVQFISSYAYLLSSSTFHHEQVHSSGFGSKTQLKMQRQEEQKRMEMDMHFSLLQKQIQDILSRNFSLDEEEKLDVQQRLSHIFKYHEFIFIPAVTHIKLIMMLIQEGLFQSKRFGMQYQKLVVDEQAQERKERWARANELKNLEQKRNELEDAFEHIKLKITKLKNESEGNIAEEQDPHNKSEENKSGRDSKRYETQQGPNISNKGEEEDSIAKSVERRRRNDDEQKSRKKELIELERERNKISNELNQIHSLINRVVKKQTKSVSRLEELAAQFRDNSRLLGRDRLGRLYWYLSLDDCNEPKQNDLEVDDAVNENSDSRAGIFLVEVPSKIETILDEEYATLDDVAMQNNMVVDGVNHSQDSRCISRYSVISDASEIVRLKEALNDSSSCEKLLKDRIFASILPREVKWYCQEKPYKLLRKDEKTKLDQTLTGMFTSWLSWSDEVFRSCTCAYEVPEQLNVSMYKNLYKSSFERQLKSLQHEFVVLMETHDEWEVKTIDNSDQDEINRNNQLNAQNLGSFVKLSIDSLWDDFEERSADQWKISFKEWLRQSYSFFALFSEDWNQEKTKFVVSLMQDWEYLEAISNYSEISFLILSLIRHIKEEQVRIIKRVRDRYSRKGLIPPPSLSLANSRLTNVKDYDDPLIESSSERYVGHLKNGHVSNEKASSASGPQEQTRQLRPRRNQPRFSYKETEYEEEEENKSLDEDSEVEAETSSESYSSESENDEEKSVKEQSPSLNRKSTRLSARLSEQKK